MADPDDRFVIVADSHDAAEPGHWVVSAEAETLDAVRRLSHLDKPPVRLPRDAYRGDLVERTLVFLAAERRPEPAAIYRLTPAAPGAEPPDPHGSSRRTATEPTSQAVLERLLLQKAGVAVSDGDSYARLQALGFIGTQKLAINDFAGAEGVFSEALDLARQIDHPPSIVKTLASRGQARLELGRPEEAIRDLEAALGLARRDRLVEEEGPALTMLADALARSGRTGEAQELLASRTKLAETAGDPAAAARAKANEGIAHCEAGDPAAGRPALEEAAAAFKALGLEPELARTLAYLAAAQRAAGDARACFATCAAHLDLCASLGDFSTAGTTFVNMAQILFASGLRAEACDVLRHGLEAVEDPMIRRRLSGMLASFAPE